MLINNVMSFTQKHLYRHVSSFLKTYSSLPFLINFVPQFYNLNDL